jgi:hypothetical protein
MNFRSFDAVNGLRPPEATRFSRVLDSVKTRKNEASMRKDGAPRRTRAAAAADG